MPTKSRTFAQKKPSVYIRTFGCQMNTRDSEFIAGLFLEKGYKLTDLPDNADIVLFNACSVRKHAEERAISNMGHFMHRYKNKKIYGMVGCAAQALKGELFERLPALNLVCGTGEIAKLPELIEQAQNNKISALDNIDKPLPESNSIYRQDGKHAYVSIMRGCDNFCSYCVVPYVRGKERSRNVKDILAEIKTLVKRGIKDITLLGQNVNSYNGIACNDKEHKTCSFVQLLHLINNIEGIEKIRFMTSHPKDANVDLFKAMNQLDRVVEHLHLPLQSGSDRILSLMNRGYTAKKYQDLIAKARYLVPKLRLTTDIIVGFPTETRKILKIPRI